MNSLEELETWKKPRSSRSATSHIAEDFGCFHFQEDIQFCRQTRGSLTATLDRLIRAPDENPTNQNTLDDFKLKIPECIKILSGYIVYLKRSGPDNQ